jgi:hypothetical protein
MTPVDQTIADDLTALAADSRREQRSGQDALRAALASARREATPRPIDPQLAAVYAARVFAARVARAAAGAVVVLCTVSGLVVVRALGLDLAPGTPLPWWAWPLDGNAAAIAVLIAALAVGAYVGAGSLASRWIEARWRRATAGTSDIAGTPGARIARWLGAAAVALPVAGATSALLALGMLAWSAGRQPCTQFWFEEPAARSLFADRLRDLTIAIPVAIAAAIALGHACTRSTRWVGLLTHRGTAWLGIALALLTIRVAAVHHLGPFSGNAAQAVLASSPLRSALTLTGAVAAFLVAAQLALGRRRRELRDLEAAPGALQPADGELVSLAGVLRSRAARMAAGGVAAMLAVGLTLVLHHPRQGISSALEILELGARLPWVVGDHITLVAAVAALVLGAMPLGAAIADRGLARRLARGPTDESADARLALARRLVRRLDGVSLGIAIAGGSAIVSVFAIVELAIGDSYWAFFTHHGPLADGMLRPLRREVVAAVAASFTAGLALAEAAGCARRARRMACGLALLAHPTVTVAAVTLGTIASVMWLRLDSGASYIAGAAADLPSRALEGGLTAALTGAVVIVASGLALRRRRREHERTGVNALAPNDAPAAPGGAC